MHKPRATYYRHLNTGGTEIEATTRSPKNALSDEENQAVLDLLHSERFVDKTPYEVYNTLIDEGHHYCSTRTMYRLLGSQNEIIDRPRVGKILAGASNRKKPGRVTVSENDAIGSNL